MGHTARVQCIRQPGRSPYYTLQIRRKRHYLGIDPKIAYRKAASLMAHVPIRGEPLSIGGLIHRWLHEHPSPKHDESLKPWALFQADTPLDEFDGLRGFAKHLIGRGLSPETIRKYVGIAKRVCRWGLEQKWLPSDLKMPETGPAYDVALLVSNTEIAMHGILFIVLLSLAGRVCQRSKTQQAS